MIERRNKRLVVPIVLTVMIIIVTALLTSCGLLRGPHKMEGPSVSIDGLEAADHEIDYDYDGGDNSEYVIIDDVFYKEYCDFDSWDGTMPFEELELESPVAYVVFDYLYVYYYPVANYEEGQWIVSLMDEAADENQPFDNLEHIFKRIETEDVPDRIIEAHELEKQIGN